ncbi:PP2C family protein-serine/threonine phosphatase [Streptomyces sp. MCA2]|uniref:PP2C family protein-serine/threonine phosphatase n=1 Tax=Streptomyces sp. MCA2 TaxID=2944805 RepID=UPI00201FE64C|nr:PP2C family protein-serine/threonine phosphatase [Streptomyces sp. MCA2]MCL7493629.1 serine/threonine-protein phosphatase [Streptomyces sp. MCA2]
MRVLPVLSQVRRWVPAVVIALAALVDLLTPPSVSSTPLLAVAPVTAASLLSPAGIITIGITAMAVQAGLAFVDGSYAWQGDAAVQITLAAVTALAVGLNRSLRTQHVSASRARYAAEVAQRAVLPTPPSRLGDLRIAARYVPAEDMALIGGDLYVMQETPFGVRAMVGDVRGKGLSAVTAVSVDIGVFRYAADHEPDLPALVNCMEEALMRESQRREGLDATEGFTTALIVQFSPDLDQVHIVNRGHPAPLLLHADGRARVLAPEEEAPPLGIAALGPWTSPVETHPFPPGSMLLCFTDGVTEARDPAGTFYDPAQRIPHMVQSYLRQTSHFPEPSTVLDLLARDVSRHSGGAPQDDQALLALHRPPPQQDLLARPLGQ